MIRIRGFMLILVMSILSGLILTGCADKSAPVSFVDFTATPTSEFPTETPTPIKKADEPLRISMY